VYRPVDTGKQLCMSEKPGREAVMLDLLLVMCSMPCHLSRSLRRMGTHTKAELAAVWLDSYQLNQPNLLGSSIEERNNPGGRLSCRCTVHLYASHVLFSTTVQS